MGLYVWTSRALQMRNAMQIGPRVLSPIPRTSSDIIVESEVLAPLVLSKC